MAPEIVPPMTPLVLMKEEGVGVSKEEEGSEEEAGTAVEELVSDGVIVGTAAVIKNRVSFGFTLALKNHSSCNTLWVIDLFQEIVSCYVWHQYYK